MISKLPHIEARSPVETLLFSRIWYGENHNKIFYNLVICKLKESDFVKNEPQMGGVIHHIFDRTRLDLDLFFRLGKVNHKMKE